MRSTHYLVWSYQICVAALGRIELCLLHVPELEIRASLVANSDVVVAVLDIALDAQPFAVTEVFAVPDVVACDHVPIEYCPRCLLYIASRRGRFIKHRICFNNTDFIGHTVPVLVASLSSSWWQPIPVGPDAAAAGDGGAAQPPPASPGLPVKLRFI